MGCRPRMGHNVPLKLGQTKTQQTISKEYFLFFATALGIFLGTSSRTMAQFALLITLVIVVLQLLSGGSTPVESQPQWLQWITFFLASRHFVSFSQVIINRGGGIRAVWPQFLMVSSIGLGFFVYSLMLFHRSIAVTK